MKKALIACILTLLACALGGFLYQNKAREARQTDFSSYLKIAHTIDRQIYAGLPIYADARNAKKEKLLRTFLLKDHLAAAAASGLPAVLDDTHRKEMIKAKRLVALEQDSNTPYYFFNVRKEHRFLTPAARRGLLQLCQKLQEIIRNRLKARFDDRVAAPFMIKLAISSALRPVAYQQNLRGRNANAAFASSHSSGLSFDIFYDDFFIALPEANSGAAVAEKKAVRRQLGFLIGRARRRQLRSMLVEALLDLQAAGFLYAIWERNQRCYHVTILPPGFAQ